MNCVRLGRMALSQIKYANNRRFPTMLLAKPNSNLIIQNQRSFFSKKSKDGESTQPAKEEEEAKVEEESKKDDKVKEKSSSSEEGSSSDSDIELSPEDIKKIKALIAEQDETIEKLQKEREEFEKQIKELKGKVIYQMAENDNTVKRYRK